MVRKEILGTSERKIIEAYLKGERLKGYTAVLFRIRKIGLKPIIEGCERDLSLLKKLLRVEELASQKQT
jgi:tyrosine-protein phosphatase YwqE